jgi:hypothetical protein
MGAADKKDDELLVVAEVLPPLPQEATNSVSIVSIKRFFIEIKITKRLIL